MKKWIALALTAFLASSMASEQLYALRYEQQWLLASLRQYVTRNVGEPSAELTPLPEYPGPSPRPSPSPTYVPPPRNSWQSLLAFATLSEPDAMSAFAGLYPSPNPRSVPVNEPLPELGRLYTRLQQVDKELYALQAETGTLPKKIVYLTIDDGPGYKTFDLLDVLARYNVRATFFLVGDRVRGNPGLIQDILAEGHVVANHSHSHERERFTGGTVPFETEFRRMEESVESALGFPVPINILRVPYGSSTVGSRSLIHATEMGYLWIDWNCSNSDASKEPISDARLISSATYAVGKLNTVVLLIHDNKGQTVKTLPAIIERYLAAGYVFLPLTPNVRPVEKVRMASPFYPME